MQFGSDNQTGASPQVLDFIVRANSGRTSGYGDDEWTARATAALSDVFERHVEVFFVATGTAANGLALSAMVQPWQTVFCHAQSHIAMDESTAPELFTSGARLVPLGQGEGKLSPAALRDGLRRVGQHIPHSPQPAALSLAQATECGTVYTAAELQALTSVAHAHGLKVHLDGARFANALVSQQCSPAQLSWKAGVDILALGATKNGCLAAEAIIVFDPALAAHLAARRKRSGHLLSKGRLFGAQILGWLQDGHWLELARDANRQALRLSQQLAALPGIRLAWPVDANEVFVVLPRRVADQLLSAGAQFYDWHPDALAAGERLGNDQAFVRLVCAFTTTDREVDGFIAAAKEAMDADRR